MNIDKLSSTEKGIMEVCELLLKYKSERQSIINCLSDIIYIQNNYNTDLLELYGNTWMNSKQERFY